MRHYKANARRDGVRPVVKRHMPTSYEATGPNQVWMWDITYLRDAEHSTPYYYAFAVIDIYSRYMVHYDVFEAKTAQNAVRFLSEAMDKHSIRPRCLVLHSDNGAAMKAAETLGLLAVRGVEFSHSRPRVSNDNPYSESLFKESKKMPAPSVGTLCCRATPWSLTGKKYPIAACLAIGLTQPLWRRHEIAPFEKEDSQRIWKSPTSER